MRGGARWLKGTIDSARRSRTVLVALGIFLVFLPTAFGVFPEAVEWCWFYRLLLILAWLLAAGFVVWGAVLQGEQVEEAVARQRAERTDERRLAAERVLPPLLEHGTGLPDHCEMRLFVYDDEQGLLTSIHDPEGRPSSGWAPGTGATGMAWQTGQFILVTGEKVSDDTYGLTPEQQKEYADLAVVAAMPVKDRRDRVIAVLTGSSETDDGSLSGPNGADTMSELALVVGRLFFDLLGEPE